MFGGGLGANDYTIAQGILYAIEKGAKVINMSLGGYFSSPILEEAVQKAIDAGITVVAAAGNDATDMYSTPAAYEGVISVGATDSKNKLAEFSNYTRPLTSLHRGRTYIARFTTMRKARLLQS